MSQDFYNFYQYFKEDEEKNNNYEGLKLDNLNTTTNEGKYLLAAVAILTTSEFEFKGEKIDGKSLEPNKVFELLEIIVKEIYEKPETYKVERYKR